MQASLLVYDIPQALSKAGVANPSGRLRKLGIRINLSCWVIPNDLIPYPYLQWLKDKGADWKIAKFDAGDIDNLRSIVQDALRRQVKEIGKSCKDSIKKLDAKLHSACQEATTARENEKARRYYKVTAAAAVKRANKMLKDIEQAAKGFGIKSAPNGHLNRVRQAVSGLEMSAVVRCRIYTDMARGVLDPTLAAAAEEGELPWQALSDVIEEQGGDASALRLAFADA